MAELIETREIPDRDTMRTGLELRIGDRKRVERLMKLLEPFFLIAERGEYPLYGARRLKKGDIARSVAESTRQKAAIIEFVSLSYPVPRQDWMTSDGFAVYREVAFAHAVRVSTDPWFDAVLKKEYGEYFTAGTADRAAADALFRRAFGNTLHVAINGTLFSGAAYPVESALIHFIAFALTDNATMTEWLVPLIRLLPRAIPLGKRGDRKDAWNVLVA